VPAAAAGDETCVAKTNCKRLIQKDYFLKAVFIGYQLDPMHPQLVACQLDFPGRHGIKACRHPGRVYQLDLLGLLAQGKDLRAWGFRFVLHGRYVC